MEELGLSKHAFSVGGLTHWKVQHPHAPNDIAQMRSGGFQAPFYAGGNQVAYYLGLKSNAVTSISVNPSDSDYLYSATERIIKEHKGK
jgi:hypothetical protein